MYLKLVSVMNGDDSIFIIVSFVDIGKIVDYHCLN